MCVAIFIVHDNVHQDFKPQQAVQGALLLTAAASTITIVFLIRSIVAWDHFERGQDVLLAFAVLAWAVMDATALVTVYARTLPPSQTWLWHATRPFIVFFGILWSVCASLICALFYNVCWPAIACMNSRAVACPSIRRRLAYELCLTNGLALMISLITTLLVVWDFHDHRWIEHDTSGAFEMRPLLPVAVPPASTRKMPSTRSFFARHHLGNPEGSESDVALLPDSPPRSRPKPASFLDTRSFRDSKLSGTDVLGDRGGSDSLGSFPPPPHSSRSQLAFSAGHHPHHSHDSANKRRRRQAAAYDNTETSEDDTTDLDEPRKRHQPDHHQTTSTSLSDTSDTVSTASDDGSHRHEAHRRRHAGHRHHASSSGHGHGHRHRHDSSTDSEQKRKRKRKQRREETRSTTECDAMQRATSAGGSGGGGSGGGGDAGA